MLMAPLFSSWTKRLLILHRWRESTHWLWAELSCAVSVRLGFSLTMRAIGVVERRKAYKDGVTIGFQIWAAHFSCSEIGCPILYSIQLHHRHLRFGLPRHGLLCNRIRAPIGVHYSWNKSFSATILYGKLKTQIYKLLYSLKLTLLIIFL